MLFENPTTHLFLHALHGARKTAATHNTLVAHHINTTQVN